MDKKEKLEKLQKFNEKDLTQKILIPLFESEIMKYQCKNVHYNHGKLEFGTDIIYYKDDEFGNRIYSGVQVKRTKILTRHVDTIFRQICEAFGEPFLNLSDGKMIDLDGFIVITSNEFDEYAKSHLWASLRGVNLHKKVTFIDGVHLLDLLEKYLPSVIHQHNEYLYKDIDENIKKFGDMLNNPDIQESDFKHFFVENPWLIGIGLTHKDIVQYEENETYPRVDLSLRTFENDYDIMILKKHTDPIFEGNELDWKLSEGCITAISQVLKYFEWYEQTITKEHYKSQIDVYKPTGFIVIGRNLQKPIQSKLKLINSHYNLIKFLTYDDLYEKAKRLKEFKTKEGKPSELKKN